MNKRNSRALVRSAALLAFILPAMLPGPAVRAQTDQEENVGTMPGRQPDSAQIRPRRLLAASEVLHAFRIDGVDSTLPMPVGELGEVLDDVFEVADSLPELAPPIPLLGQAREILPLPESGYDAIVFTDRGSYLCRHGGGPMDSLETRLIHGARDILDAEESSDGIVYALERPLGEPSGGEPCELFAFDAAGPEETRHLAYVDPQSVALGVTLDDGEVWIARATGRTVERVARRGSSWTSVTWTVPQGTEELESSDWLLRHIFLRAHGGPIALELGRGTSPALFRLRTDGTAREMYRWRKGFFVRGGWLAQSGRILLLNTTTHLLLIDLETWDELWVWVPERLLTAAISSDGRLAACVLATGKGQSRVDVLDLGTGRTLRSRKYDEVLRAVAFF